MLIDRAYWKVADVLTQEEYVGELLNASEAVCTHAGQSESAGEGHLDNSEGDFGSGDFEGTGSGQGYGFDQQSGAAYSKTLCKL